MQIAFKPSVDTPVQSRHFLGLQRRTWLIVHAAALMCALLLVAGADAAQTVRRDEFIAMLFNARGFQLPTGEKSPVAAALDYDLVPVPEGKYAEPITRKEAIVFAVRSLGLIYEPRMLATFPLPYKDTGTLSAEEKGALAVALNMKPPLLAKNVSNFAPSHKISPSEAKDIASIVAAATRNLSLTVDLSPRRGMTIRLHREGVNSVLPKWRGVVNGFDTKEEADAFRGMLTGLGVEATVDSYNYDWRVRSPLFDRYGGVRKFLAATRSLGREGVVFAGVPSWDTVDNPRCWTLITFDPGLFEIRPLLPSEGMSALVPLSTMLRDGAVAAVNGGFFSTSGKGRGNPIGALMVDGCLVNPPTKGRTCFGWNADNRAVFGELSWTGRVDLSGGYMELNAVNRAIKGDGAVAFSSHFGEVTPVAATRAAEAVLSGGIVEQIRAGGGNPIPDGRTVLSVYGPAARFIEALQFGERVGITHTLNEGDPSWMKMTQIIQGGPFLLSNGDVLDGRESLSDSVVDHRHPRTAVGLTKEGRWFFFVGDGRNAVHSVGFTLDETARVLKSAGAVYALNLDGGGSSSIISEGAFWNVLSDGLERPVSYGVGAFPREVGTGK